MNFQEIITEINNAFFRLESFMNGKINNYQYFGFNDVFTKLFIGVKKPENFTYSNCKLIGEYWKLTEQIRVDYDQSDYENASYIWDNDNEEKVEGFIRDCDEIMYLNYERFEEFTAFSTPDEIAEDEHKFSITDILKTKPLPPPPSETKTEQETPPFTNNFDKITTNEIYKHFKAGLVEKGYLTEQELNEYLKAAFELKTKPETLFKIKDAPNKATIEAVFYKYYKNVAGKIHGTQNQYAALLGDYFEGYKTPTVSSNFSKSVY